MRDTIARQFDVDKNTVDLKAAEGAKGSYQPGTIIFCAEKGKSVDLEKLHESLKATRLGKGTSSQVTYLEITATGEVTVSDKGTLLKVSGTGQQFLLADAPDAKVEEGKKTPFQRLQEAVNRGAKVTSVTGRVQGWTGRWPKVLSELPGETIKDSDKRTTKRMTLLVTDFQTIKE